MKFKKMKWFAIISATALAVAIMTISVMAYFSTIVYVYTNDGNKEKFHAGMNLTLLFDKLVPGGSLVDDTTKLPFIDYANTTDPENPVYYTYDKDATWGTEKNPYIISDIRHLQNLSALQDIGYFYKLNIIKNFNKDTNGNPTTYIAGSNDKPYFLVCKNDGKPVTINGEGIKIKPIGTEQYPFIGEIGGAIITQKSETEEYTTTVGALESDTSAIYNITVMSKRKMPDHGLFGYVSYLGQAPSEWTSGATTFQGYISKISNLLMADVTLEVKDTNFVDTVADWISGTLKHEFSYSTFLSASETLETLKTKMPCETHHIGILAGHVNYVDVENISIYYSSDNIVCIDLNDKKSVVGTGEPDDGTSGGFDNNYFSSTGIIGYIYSMNPQYTGNTISIGTGSSSTSVGSLGGGGSASGVNPGYVLAADMYGKFSQYSKPAVLTVDELTSYVLGDSQVGFIIYASRDNEDNPIFIDELGRQLFPETASNGYYASGRWYYMKNNARVYLNEEKFFYCQLEIVDYDDDGNYVSEPRYYKTITGIGTYTITGHNEVFKKLTGTAMNAPEIELDAINSDMYLYTAKTDAKGTALCVQWYRDRLFSNWINLGKEATGRYYFYDGVFTFALSGTKDAVCEIWPLDSDGNTTVPSINLTKNESDWEKGTVKKYSYKLTLSRVQNNEGLTSKGMYILAYQGLDTDVDGGNTPAYFLMNMFANSSEANGAFGQTKLSTLDGFSNIQLGDNYYEIATTQADVLYNYAFTYSGGRIRNIADTSRYFGIHASTRRAGMFWGYQETYYPYAGSDPTDYWEQSGTGMDYGHHYSYETELSCENGAATVTFTSVKYGYSKIPDGTKPIYLTYSSATYNNRYGIYSGSNAFGVSTSSGSNFMLYKIEITPVAEESSGLVTSNPAKSENADKYVLWPMNTFYGANTATGTQYGLVSMEGLGSSVDDGGKGWRYANGSYLADPSINALKYIFNLANGARFGSVSSNALNSGGDWDSDGVFVKAKLGSDGAETYIPMGCISFKVNKTPAENDPIKIRVIVAVPSSYQAGALTATEYSFGLWKNSLYSGQSETFNFQQTGTIAKFELPRSQPLATDPDGNFVTTGAATQVYYDVDGSGAIENAEKTDGNLYTTYFQGETVLVAYEFNVTEAGVYTLGAIGGPMQIVYFSADGVASLGRDGTGGAQLEGIDFVYDFGGNIVTVNNAPAEGANTEDYKYYYESGCLLHFDNEVQNQNQYVRIFHEKIYIRRYVDSSLQTVQKTVLKFGVTEATELSKQETNRYVKLEDFALKHDNIVYRTDDIYKKQSSATS